MAVTKKVEKSEVNQNIVNKTLQNPFAYRFTNKSFTTNPYHLDFVLPHTPEYNEIQNLFGHPWKILQILRIENPFLAAQYLLTKEKMIKEGKSVNERRLFHGTRYFDGICRHNFNWRLRGWHRGHKFGQGICFTPFSSYAQHYSQGTNMIVLARVLVGNSTLGSPSDKVL